MKKIGFVGWRGMVGSVLLSRMVQESDFNHITQYFRCKIRNQREKKKLNVEWRQ